ncbi:MAG: DUF3558 family protein [Dehalococcoidia bacterium]
MSNSSRRMALRALACLVLGSLVVIGCGGDDDGGDSATPTATEADAGGATATAAANGGDIGAGFDACTLLTMDEVEAAIGAVDAGLRREGAKISSCLWSAKVGRDFVNVGVFLGSKQELDLFLELAQGTEDVEGLGDRAKFSEPLGATEVIVGGYGVTVSAGTSEREPDEVRDVTTALAEKVVERLP